MEGAADETGRRGEELHGGSGNDYLYGNLRRDLLFGGRGNDYLHGEYLAGPDYVDNTLADAIGAQLTVVVFGGCLFAAAAVLASFPGALAKLDAVDDTPDRG